MSRPRLIATLTILICGTISAQHTLAAPPSTKWWSFSPVVRPEPPKVKQAGWAINPIDAFVLASLENKGLHPATPAERRTLIRRVTFDLIGLPPSPAEVEAFVSDSSPDAYEKLVERLLASERYGERWGRHWLDVARFSESDGFEEDQQRLNSWRYRDYVIDSFNADKPYDQFVREQIAGDVLEPVTTEGIVATGFLVAGPWDAIQRVTPSALGRLQSREEQLEEMVAAVGQTFLGVTVQCARCHDHKFDPITQVDYYRLKSALEGVDHGLAPRAHGIRELDLGDANRKGPAAVKLAELRKVRIAIAATQAELGKADAASVEAAQLAQKIEGLGKQLQALITEVQTLGVPFAFTGDREQPKPTVVFNRGDIKTPKEVVSPGGLSSIANPAPDFGLSPDAPEGQRRQKLAAWITDPANPLTARVMVNRIWQYHFGTGIVEHPSDMGKNGGAPSHPELLDWLASEFVAKGWSVKAMHRLIVSSATYRQSSQFNPEAAKIDAENRLLWRYSPHRFEAEMVRDAMLAVSGQLNLQKGGESFKPYTVTQLNTYFYHLFDSDKPEFNRRTVYRMNLITGRSPFLDALDCPSPSVASPRRRNTTTPLQALALMNDSFVLRQADRFAQRLVAMAPNDLPKQLSLACELALNRPARSDELPAMQQLAREHGLDAVCWALLNSSEFLRYQ